MLKDDRLLKVLVLNTKIAVVSIAVTLAEIATTLWLILVQAPEGHRLASSMPKLMILARPGYFYSALDDFNKYEEGSKIMQNVTIQITEQELSGLLRAHQTLQAFLERFLSPNELYRSDFLNGLKEAQDDIEAGRLNEVRNFENFAQ